MRYIVQEVGLAPFPLQLSPHAGKTDQVTRYMNITRNIQGGMNEYIYLYIFANTI